MDGYIHTVTEVAADGTVSDVTDHVRGRQPSALIASIDALQQRPMGGTHQATFWETTIARATTDEATAYVWEVDTFRIGAAHSTPLYATRSTTAYRLLRDGDSLRIADSWVLEKTTSEISAGSQSLAAEVFQNYLDKWFQGRLAGNTAVLTEVAAVDELSRLQIPIVQAPLDPTLSAIDIQADMVPLEASGSELLMAVTQSRKETRGQSQSPPASETRLLRFVMTDDRWLAVASEPISSDESAPSSQSTCG